MVGCPFDGLGSFIDLNDYRRPASRLSKQCVVMAGTGVSSPDQSRPAHGVEKVAWKSALTGGRPAVEFEDLEQFPLGVAHVGDHVSGFGASSVAGVEQHGLLDAGEGVKQRAYGEFDACCPPTLSMGMTPTLVVGT